MFVLTITNDNTLSISPMLLRKEQMLSMAQIIEARRASSFVAPGWHIAPTGGSEKSNQQIPLEDQRKSMMNYTKCSFLRAIGEGDCHSLWGQQ